MFKLEYVPVSVLFSKRHDSLIKDYEKKEETSRETLNDLQKKMQQFQVGL